MVRPVKIGRRPVSSPRQGTSTSLSSSSGVRSNYRLPPASSFDVNPHLLEGAVPGLTNFLTTNKLKVVSKSLKVWTKETAIRHDRKCKKLQNKVRILETTLAAKEKALEEARKKIQWQERKLEQAEELEESQRDDFATRLQDNALMYEVQIQKFKAKYKEEIEAYETSKRKIKILQCQLKYAKDGISKEKEISDQLEKEKAELESKKHSERDEFHKKLHAERRQIISLKDEMERLIRDKFTFLGFIRKLVDWSKLPSGLSENGDLSDGFLDSLYTQVVKHLENSSNNRDEGREELLKQLEILVRNAREDNNASSPLMSNITSTANINVERQLSPFLSCSSISSASLYPPSTSNRPTSSQSKIFKLPSSLPLQASGSLVTDSRSTTVSRRLVSSSASSFPVSGSQTSLILSRTRARSQDLKSIGMASPSTASNVSSSKSSNTLILGSKSKHSKHLSGKSSRYQYILCNEKYRNRKDLTHRILDKNTLTGGRHDKQLRYKRHWSSAAGTVIQLVTKKKCNPRTLQQVRLLIKKKHAPRIETRGLRKGSWYCCCGSKFSSEKCLQKHVTYFTKEWKFRCNHCQKWFCYLTNLKQHLTKVHNSRSPLEKYTAGCQECGKIFRNQSELYQHKKVKHNFRRQVKSRSVPSLPGSTISTPSTNALSSSSSNEKWFGESVYTDSDEDNNISSLATPLSSQSSHLS